MGNKINLLNKLPKSSRPLNVRGEISPEDKEHHWSLSREYFDGTRVQGYGGYINDGRWFPVAGDIIDYYKIKAQNAILEIGCAKGFLLDAFNQHDHTLELWGIDISQYALSQTTKSIPKHLVLGNAKDLPFDNNSFDLLICINSLHNILNVNDTLESLREIQRVSSKNSYITVGAYSNDEEKKIIDNWAIVATTYMHENDWLELFDKAGYKGDYFWFKPQISFGDGLS